ncbi:MAG: cupin domain-containing protein [Candidatus Binataceae bacterium]
MAKREFRRIVTGHNAQGKSIVVNDGPGRAQFDEHGGGTCEFWVTGAIPVDNKSPNDPADRPRKLEPPANGSILRYFALPPESIHTAAEWEEHARKMFEAIGASHCRVDTSRHPAMHRTRTLDYIILLEGEVSMLLDEGEVKMKPFDVLIQRGTNHGWVNHGKTTALLAAVLIDAQPAP